MVHYLLGFFYKDLVPRRSGLSKTSPPYRGNLLIWTMCHCQQSPDNMQICFFQGLRQPTWPETHVLSWQANKQTGMRTWSQMHLEKHMYVQVGWNQTNLKLHVVFLGVGGTVFFCSEPGHLLTTLMIFLVGLRWSLPSEYSSESFGNVLCVCLPHAANSHSEDSRSV